MRKIAPAAFLVSGLIVFGGLFVASPAQADDDEISSSTQVGKAPRENKEPKELKEPKETKQPRESGEKGTKKHELEQKYGKEGRLSLPPLVIRPKRDTDEVAGDSGVSVQDSDSDDQDQVSGAASAGSGPAVTKSSGTTGTSSGNSSGSDSKVGTASAGFIAINPAAKDSLVTVKSGTMVNPQQNTAIDLSKVEFTKKTPSDVFIQSAQVGLYAMAAGALALSLFAATRAIRRK